MAPKNFSRQCNNSVNNPSDVAIWEEKERKHIIKLLKHVDKIGPWWPEGPQNGFTLRINMKP